MGLNINGATIQRPNAISTDLEFTANSIRGLYFTLATTSGYPFDSKRPYFIAQNNTNTWIQYTAGSWNIINPQNTIVNNGSPFNPANGRFTAPIKGTYYLLAQTYSQHYPTPTRTNYNHPMFWVNGSSTSRQGSYTTSYRLAARTYYTGTYSYDTPVENVLELEAGDYVEYRVYANNANLRHYSTRDMFAGVLLG